MDILEGVIISIFAIIVMIIIVIVGKLIATRVMRGERISLLHIILNAAKTESSAKWEIADFRMVSPLGSVRHSVWSVVIKDTEEDMIYKIQFNSNQSIVRIKVLYGWAKETRNMGDEDFKSLMCERADISFIEERIYRKIEQVVLKKSKTLLNAKAL